MPSGTTERHALVTGASEGIGRAIALALTREGWIVTAVARNAQRLAALTDEVKKRGRGEVIPLVADLSTSEGTRAVIAAFEARKTALLVNNAGFGLYGAYSKQDWDKLLPLMRLNIEALAQLSHAYMKIAEAGDALVNVSSTLAFMPMPSAALYAASKSFVTSLSESLWYEGRQRGVYVMNLCPGVTESEFHARAGGRHEKRPPAFMTATADDVVATMMAALEERSSPTVVSGWPNRTMQLVARALGRRLTTMMMGVGAKV